MTAVWLSDELMVTPGAVVGLRLTFDQAALNAWCIQAVLTGGGVQWVWKGIAHGSKGPAEAEMERLSALLWPPEPDVGFNHLLAELPSPKHVTPDIRFFDPELYGMTVCDEARLFPEAGWLACDLGVDHEPWSHRFSRPLEQP